MNGTAQHPLCGEAFASDFNGGYSFMSVLTHTKGRAAVQPLPQNVCGFNSETWQGKATPWDAPINWPATSITAGPQTFSWNISWGSHFSDTEEFRYWITKPGFQYQVGRPLAWNDFEEASFCTLKYSDANPGGNPDVTADKAAAMFHTRCTVPPRQGRHVIYAEWGRNQWTYERFHSCVDVSFTGTGQVPDPDFSLSMPASEITTSRGANQSSIIAINRTGGLAGNVLFSASGLPPGVTATFQPASTGGATTTLTLTASSSAAVQSTTVTIYAVAGSLSRSLPLTLAVVAERDFSLSAGDPNLSLRKGGTASTSITLNRIAFSGAISFAASGLPPGVVATFSPASTTGASTNVAFAASSSAATGPSRVVIAGSSGAESRTVELALIVTGQPTGPSSISVSPQTLNLTQGSSTTATVSLEADEGFADPVTFTASELPVGVTATFGPVSASGATTLTLSASSAAITGSATVRITGASGANTAALSVPFTVTRAATAGAMNLAPLVTVNHGWYNELAVRLENTAPVTALSVTIEIQRTPGLTFAGQYNTLGGQIQQTSTATANIIRYVYSLAPGQVLATGAYRTFAAQAGGNGAAHPTAGDTFKVTYTMGGVSFTETGHF